MRSGTASTAASRLRSMWKYIASAEHRLGSAVKQTERLRHALFSLNEVREELQGMDVTDSDWHAGMYSQRDVERALLRYLQDGERARLQVRVDGWREVFGSYADDEEIPAGGNTSEADVGIMVTPMPRTRNVFGERLSSPKAGRMDRRRLPRDAGPVPALMLGRADLQRAMRSVSRRSAEITFLRS